MHKVKVNTKLFKQEIFIGNNIVKEILMDNNSCNYDKIIFIIDENVNNSYKDYLYKIVKDIQNHEIFILSNNTKKDYKSCWELIIELSEKYNISRNTCICWIGWGKIWDLLWFISSIYMRWIDFIFIPTTLMSQVDSIIWKIAVDCWNKKNLVWIFWSPKINICDTYFINNLPKYNILQWLIEVWKHWLIENDENIIKYINNSLQKSKFNKIENIIYRSLKIKKKYIVKDLYDKNWLHKALSLWHTFSNFLEKSDKLNIQHWEWVLFWIIFEAFLSLKLKYILDENFENIIFTSNLFMNLFKDFIDIKNMITILDFEELIKSLKSDKISNWNIKLLVITNNWYEIVDNIKEEIIKEILLKFIKYLNNFIK